jgi:myo-inositol-1(or 4)-monophosphatase
MAAGALMIQEAGGLVGDLRGDAGYLESGEICAATPKIFPVLVEALAV